MFGEDSWNINVVIVWRVTSPRFGLDAIGVDISPKRIKQVEMDGDFTFEDRMIKNMDMYGHSPTAVISSTFDGVRNKPGSSSGQVRDIGFGHQLSVDLPLLTFPGAAFECQRFAAQGWDMWDMWGNGCCFLGF